MKINKKIIGALLSASAITTVGASALTSCSDNKIRMLDVADLFANGYTRTTACAQAQKVAKTEATQWYFGKIAANKEILRDDLLSDSFPKKESNEGELEANGQFGLEVVGIDKTAERMSFDISFDGTVKNMFVPWFPFVTENDIYLWANVNAKIEVRNVKAKVYYTTWGTWKGCGDYFKEDTEPFDPKGGADLDINKLITDEKWSVNLKLSFRGGYKEGVPFTPGEQMPTDINNNATILFKHDFKREGETGHEALEAMAKVVSRATIKKLEYMKDVDPN